MLIGEGRQEEMLQQTKEGYANLIECYGDMIYRYCLIHLRNETQASDIYQDVFLKLYEKQPVFRDEEHAKAWLLKVCMNLCKNKIRYKIMHSHHELQEELHVCKETEDFGLLDQLKKLPWKYSVCLYLFYYEDYAIKEIAQMLHRKESTVKTWLSRGKEELKSMMIKERELYEEDI